MKYNIIKCFNFIYKVTFVESKKNTDKNCIELFKKIN